MVPTTIVPFESVNLPMVALGTDETPPEEVDASVLDVGAAGFCAEVAPRLEKFQVPAGDRNRVTSGSVIVNDSTSSRFEKIKGKIWTPAVSCFAMRKGEWLNAGSSAMDTLSTVTPPEKIAS